MLNKQDLILQLKGDTASATRNEKLFPNAADYFIGRRRQAEKIVLMLNNGIFDTKEDDC